MNNEDINFEPVQPKVESPKEQESVVETSKLSIND